MKKIIATAVITTLLKSIITLFNKNWRNENNQDYLTKLDKETLNEEQRIKFWWSKGIYVTKKQLNNLLKFMKKNGFTLKQIVADFKAGILRFDENDQPFFEERRNKNGYLITLFCYMFFIGTLFYINSSLKIKSGDPLWLLYFIITIRLLANILVSYFLLIFIPSFWLNNYFTIKKRKRAGYLK